jgi:hypothetical protein
MLACILSLGVLGLAWAQSTDTFTLFPVAFEDNGGGKEHPAKIPSDWKLVSVEHYKINETQLWFTGPDGTIYMVHGFLDDKGYREPRFRLMRPVNVIEVEK